MADLVSSLIDRRREQAGLRALGRAVVAAGVLHAGALAATVWLPKLLR